MTRAWHITPDSAILQFAAFTFDVSVMDMFMPLLTGARLVLASNETLHSPPRLAALIRDRHVTFACLTPAVLALLAGEDFPDLRVLVSAGDELSADLARRWIRPGLRFINGYGPTETAVIATEQDVDAKTPQPPPIGRPIPNYQAYVLDAHLNPVPVGITGELHIGGPGLARGYLNQPQLTNQKFIPHPFQPHQRIYKTGDLTHRNPDGTITFTGRADNQIKIRGLRIELGEIETALTNHPTIAQAIVTTITTPTGDKQLAAYLRPHPNTTPPTPTDLRTHLTHTLPTYMIPTHLTLLDTLPLTTNGKINKAALPPPAAVLTAADPVPPRTLLETLLVDFYATILGNERVGATDGFFDLGGSSLQAMRLVTQLRTALAIDLDVSAVFVTPTPQRLAAALRDEHGLDDADLDQEPVPGAAAAPAGQNATG
jgi:acyl-coenzyme A synthetase/AMP-(fatty) acid ligase